VSNTAGELSMYSNSFVVDSPVGGSLWKVLGYMDQPQLYSFHLPSCGSPLGQLVGVVV
jgi:hypothetical protein